MGRPSKLRPDLQQKIISSLRAGNYFDAACLSAGIHESTGYRWLQRGEAEMQRLDNDSRARPKAEEAVFVDFCKAVKEAAAEAENEYVALIKHAAKGTLIRTDGTRVPYEGQWQAAAWWLERRFPDKWGRQRVEHTGKDGGAIEFKLSFDNSENG